MTEAGAPAEQSLRELATAFGIATRYDDWRGQPVEVPAETLRTVLSAMDVDVSSPEAVADARARVDERAKGRMLPHCMVVVHGAETVVRARIPSAGSPAVGVQMTVELEDGGLVDVPHGGTAGKADAGAVAAGAAGAAGLGAAGAGAARGPAELMVELPRDLPLGYHRVRLRSGTTEAVMALIVTPAALQLPDRLRPQSWGFAAQLYSVRSAESWGVGDLTDLADLAVWSGAELGADYVLVNPLHAAEPVAPMEPSPYLPSSRRFANPLYLRVERIPEYADLSEPARARVDVLAQRVRRELNAADTIDRNTSWTAKQEALRLVFMVPRSAGRAADFSAYCRREGQGLHEVAVWRVLAAQHGSDYRQWPEALRDPASTAVAAAAEEHAEAVDFEMWLQWVLDEQLMLVQAKARASGMALGVMHDLAVGVHPGGADAWRAQSTYAIGVQVGAPPDAFNQRGQGWGQPPWRPDRLEELAYRPFRELLATVLRHAGGVRVDHILGLFRLWWVPEGAGPGEGTYVRYDADAIVGVLALEAHRAGVVVVGEDLGTVEASVRTTLAARGVLGTSLLWFERDADGGPLPAESWRELSMASVTTHDLPPTAAYLAGGHVRLRADLGLLTRPLEEELTADHTDRESWLAEVMSRGPLTDWRGDPAGAEVDDIEQIVLALHHYLTLTPARLLCVALVDAVGDHRTQNQPGTVDEYPNWRVPLSGPDGRPMTLEAVLESPRARRLAAAVGPARPSGAALGPAHASRAGPPSGQSRPRENAASKSCWE